MITGEAELVSFVGSSSRSVSVIVPVYNYASLVTDALNSVLCQTYDDLCLIIIDDFSRDSSLTVVKDWLEEAEVGQKSAYVLRHRCNAGLSATRNTGTLFSGSELCFFLDADNELYPPCIEKHCAALLENPSAAAAYSLIETFGLRAALVGCNVFNKERLRYGNYIDAMAMVRREYLLSVGGYYPMKYGWEDYDLWLRMCEGGAHAIQIPEILSRYRVHESSMLRTQTNVEQNMRELCDAMHARHPWLELEARRHQSR